MWIRTGLLGICLALAAGCTGHFVYLPAPEGAPGDWTQFGGNATGSALAPVAPEVPLRLWWQQALGGAPVGGPLVEGGLVLQQSANPALHTFDGNTGKRLGRRGFDAPLCASALLLGPYLVTGEAGPKPALRGYDRQGIQKHWSYPGLACAPLSGRGDTVVAALNAGAVVALAVADGRCLWRAQLEGPLWAAPALGGDAVFVSDGRQGLVALEMATGRERWRLDLGGGLRTAAAGKAEVFAATATGRVLACSADSGRVRWQVELGVPLAAGLALAPGVLVVGAADHCLYGLDTQTGAVRWRFQTNGVLRGAPAASATAIYAGSSDGYLYALDRDEGLLRWKYLLDGPALQPVGLGADLVAITTEKGTLYVFGK